MPGAAMNAAMKAAMNPLPTLIIWRASCPCSSPTFDDELGVVGNPGAAVGADDAAVFADAALGRVGHTDRGREPPVVDHSSDHQGCVPPVPLLQGQREIMP